MCCMHEDDLWSGDAWVTFPDGAPFRAPVRIWITLTPTPVSRFSVSFEGDVEGVPQLQTGMATLRLAGSGYEYGVVVSRVGSQELIGRFNGGPPEPIAEAVAIDFGVLNLDPRTVWLDETLVDGWCLRLSPNAQVGGRERLRDELGVAETHAGVLERTDGTSFRLSDALGVLEGWRLAVSFATGGRIGVWRHNPIPHGSGDGWRSFSSPALEPWFDRHRVIDAHDHDGLGDLVRLVHARRVDLELAAIDELAINYALEANGNSPTEMRIAAAGAGLELLAWDLIVEDGGPDSDSRSERKRRYDVHSAAENFEVLIRQAKIDTKVPAVLKGYATADGNAESGAVAIAALRNRVMHPRRRSGELSLTGEAWAAGSQLAVHYLELLILHRLGYQGRYSDRFRSRSVGNTFDVPWAAGIGP